MLHRNGRSRPILGLLLAFLLAALLCSGMAQVLAAMGLHVLITFAVLLALWGLSLLVFWLFGPRQPDPRSNGQRD